MLPELETTRAIGVAGTFVNLEALAGPLTLDSVTGQLHRLAALPLAERRRVPRLVPERAPVIVGGAVIACELLARLSVPQIEVSEHDLLDGVALELAGR